MSANYEITSDASRGLIRLTLGGFFEARDVADFAASMQNAIRDLGTPPNQHLTICDVTDCNLQAQDIVAAFRTIILNPGTMSRRLALVASSSLARIQVRRMLVRDGAQCFESIAEAERWLMAEPALQR